MAPELSGTIVAYRKTRQKERTEVILISAARLFAGSAQITAYRFGSRNEIERLQSAILITTLQAVRGHRLIWDTCS
jgi:hypothetical protein